MYYWFDVAEISSKKDKQLKIAQNCVKIAPYVNTCVLLESK